MIAIEIFVRVAGVFYLLGGLFVIRQMAMSEMLDHAIRMISLDREPRKERIRRWLLGAGAVLTGAGGAAMVLFSALALPLLSVNLVLQWSWLAWARGAFPPEDDEDRIGRARTRNAAIVCIALTALVWWLWQDGRLVGWDDLAGAAGVTAAFLGLAVYLVRSFWWTLRPGRVAGDDDRFDWKEASREREEAEKLAADPSYRHPARIRFEVHPYRYPMVDADDGRLLNHFTYLEPEDAGDIEAWHDEYVGHVIARSPGAKTVFPSEQVEDAHRARAQEFVALLQMIYGRDNVEGPVYLPLDAPSDDPGTA